MIVEVHQSTRETSSMIDLKCLSVLAVIGILVLIPQSLADPGEKLQGEAPDFGNVKLWDYNFEARANYDYFWTATNPSKYIMPDNPIIQYYANNSLEVQIDYVPDSTDRWQNPDYTLKIMKGDCEDESFVWVSIHRANRHKAIVVGGYLLFDDGTAIRDIWYEYVANGARQIKFVTPVVNVRKFYAKPLFMFNENITIREYDPGWMNMI